MQQSDNNHNIDALITITRQAGQILKTYFTQQNFWQKRKADASWLTEADLASNAHLCSEITKLYPGIPIISEENQPELMTDNYHQFWLIDPLDGTKQFIRSNPEFCIAVALVIAAKPVLGLIQQPVTGDIWFGGPLLSASYHLPANADLANKRKISAKSIGKAGLRCLTSQPPQYTQIQLQQKLNLAVASVTGLGSALKMTRIATGQADLFVKRFPIYQWDIAAGHAILASANGDILSLAAEAADGAVADSDDGRQVETVSRGQRGGRPPGSGSAEQTTPPSPDCQYLSHQYGYRSSGWLTSAFVAGETSALQRFISASTSTSNGNKANAGPSAS